MGAFSLMPLSSLPATVTRSASNMLAFVGPLAPEIGAPLAAHSDVNLDGFVADGEKAEASGASQWSTSIKTGLAMGIVFGGLVGLVIILIAQSALSVVLAVGLVAALSALFVFLFRPKKEGWTAVLGTEGLQIGKVRGTSLERWPVRFDDDDYAFFEHELRNFVRRLGSDLPPTHVSTVVTFSVRYRQDRAMVLVGERRFARLAQQEPARDFVDEVRSAAYPARLARTSAKLRAGAAVDLPLRDGGLVRILPARGVAGLPFAVELHPSSGSAMLIDAPIGLERGLYSFSAQGRTVLVERACVGDAFLLDRLVLAQLGRPMTIESHAFTDARAA